MEKKSLVILGGGESGVGAAVLGAQKGFEVFLSDFGKIQPEYQEILNTRGFQFEELQHTESKIVNADLD